MASADERIGLLPLTALVTGNLVGSGVFLLPVILAPFGTTSLLAWITASIGAMLLSLIFAKLSSKRPKTGGPYIYVREAFGDTAGYYICWAYWMLSWISNPALSVAAVGYLSTLFGGFDPWITFALEILIVASLTGINLLGMRFAGQFEFILTIFKIIPLVGLPLIAFFYIDINTIFQHINISGQSFFGALNTATLIAMWSFAGLESGTVPAGQVTNAKRIVPMATILGTFIAAIIYVSGALIIMGALSQTALINSKAPYADAAHALFGGNWGIPVTITAVIACLGTLNGWTMVVGRIPYGAAQDGLFPKLFLKTTKHGTPHYGIIISSICSLPLLALSLQNSLMDQFQFIVDAAVSMIILIYLVCVLAYVKLEIDQRQFKGKSLFLGISSILFTCWALWASKPETLICSLGILLLGIPMRLWMKRQEATPLPSTEKAMVYSSSRAL